MISERQSIAARFRSEGEGRSQEILGNMGSGASSNQSEAERRAQEILGRADARRPRSTAKPTAAIPAFYAFSRTLESYSTLGENTTLMIDANSEFFRYLESTTGR